MFVYFFIYLYIFLYEKIFTGIINSFEKKFIAFIRLQNLFLVGINVFSKLNIFVS